MCDILNVKPLSADELKSVINQDVKQQFGGVGWVRSHVHLLETSMGALLLRGALTYAFGKRHPEIDSRRAKMYVPSS
jgi:hypothetical protein